jgi:hypothetical protein
VFLEQYRNGLTHPNMGLMPHVLIIYRNLSLPSFSVNGGDCPARMFTGILMYPRFVGRGGELQKSP